MQKWEYLTVIIRGDHALNPTVYTINGKYINQEIEFRVYLVELGVEGWELVGIREDAYYFKRPIE